MLRLDQSFVDSIRKRIEDSNLVDKILDVCDMLYTAAMGKSETPLTAGQLEAARTFLLGARIPLNKVIPDLKSVEGSVKHEHTLQDLIERSYARANTAAIGSEQRPN